MLPDFRRQRPTVSTRSSSCCCYGGFAEYQLPPASSQWLSRVQSGRILHRDHQVHRLPRAGRQSVGTGPGPVGGARDPVLSLGFPGGTSAQDHPMHPLLLSENPNVEQTSISPQTPDLLPVALQRTSTKLSVG